MKIRHPMTLPHPVLDIVIGIQNGIVLRNLDFRANELCLLYFHGAVFAIQQVQLAPER